MHQLPDTKVMVDRRDANDPDWPVPVQIHCPACPGWALLQQFLIGYGYICQACSAEIPIDTANPAGHCWTCGEPLASGEGHIHFTAPTDASGTKPAGN